MRREFSKPVKRQAEARANSRCEGIVDGVRCTAILTRGKFHFDHVETDWMGGEPTLENCAVLCIPCHADKTSKNDIPKIAKAKRIIDREKGIKSQRSITSWRRFDGTIRHAGRAR